MLHCFAQFLFKVMAIPFSASKNSATAFHIVSQLLKTASAVPFQSDFY